MIFTRAEMERRLSHVTRSIEERDLDLVLVHSADSVYYLSGTPLLDEWGRPMWVAVRRDGAATIIGSYIERGNMVGYTWLDDVRPYDDAAPSLQQCLKVLLDFVRAEAAPRRIGVERSVMTLGVFDALCEEFPRAEFVDIGDVIAQARILKSREELEVLRLAADVARIGASAFVDALKVGTTELAVAAAATSAMDRALAALSADAVTSSYSYCHSGPHTLTPHLHPTGRRIERGDVIGLNVFPVVWGYCIELERTLVVGDWSDEQLRAMDAVNEAFETTKRDFRPGVSFSELDLNARRILERAGYGDNIWHGTGHAHGIMIGSTAREELGELRYYNETLVREGMANSVEPAVFIEGIGAFRHSDVLFATSDGSECVTAFPRDIVV